MDDQKEQERKFYEKRASDQQELQRQQDAFQELEDSRAYHEKQREQIMRYFDKKRDDELNRKMVEEAQKRGDTQITKEVAQELRQRTSAYFDRRQKDVDSYQSMDFRKDIQHGSMQGFDKEAADIVVKGNATTSLVFLQQAAKLSQEQYYAFTERQEALGQSIDSMREAGDVKAAIVLEARKDYEAASYERDTAASVLAKHEFLYGADSNQHREQQAELQKLSAAADELKAKFDNVLELDREVAHTLNEESMKLAQLPEADSVNERIDQAAADFIDDVPVFEDRDADVPQLVDYDHEPTRSDYETDMSDEVMEYEARQDELLKAMDEGRDPYERDSNADLDASVDKHVAEQEEIVETDSDGSDAVSLSDTDNRTSEQTGIEEKHSSEIRHETAALRPEGEMESSVQTIGVEKTDVVKDYLREQVARTETDNNFSQAFIDRMDAASEKLETAMREGDSQAILNAQDEQRASRDEFNGYMDDRDEFSAKLTNLREEGQSYLSAENETDQTHAALDFKSAYNEADSVVERVRAEDKPWAADMQSQLDNEVQKQTDTEKNQIAVGDDGERVPTSRLETAAREADDDKAQRRGIEFTSEDVAAARREAERQAQVDSEKQGSASQH